MLQCNSCRQKPDVLFIIQGLRKLVKADSVTFFFVKKHHYTALPSFSFSLFYILLFSVHAAKSGTVLNNLSVNIYKWKNQRGRIDSLSFAPKRSSYRTTDRTTDRTSAEARKSENRCVLFDSFTYIYSALLPQHWALYAKVDSTHIYIYMFFFLKFSS